MGIHSEIPQRSQKIRGIHESNAPEFASALELNAREFAERLIAFPMRKGGLCIDELLSFAKEQGIADLFVVDQKVADIESRGERLPYGYQVSDESFRITVIDHHVADSYFERLSTGNLVLEFFKHHPEGPPSDARILITHGDCDSVLSAGMLLKVIPPLPEFGEAVMSADHTFERNLMADLLQAIEGFPPIGGGTMALIEPALVEPALIDPAVIDQLDRTALVPSIELSFKSLGQLLQGKELNPLVARALEGRLSARSAWEMRLRNGDITSYPNGTLVSVISGQLTQDPYPEFLKALVPEAALILVFHQVPEQDDFLQVRALTGNTLPEHLSLGDESIITQELVPGFGGRKDAGSNRRGKQSFEDDPWKVAAFIDQRIGLARKGQN